MIRWNIPPHLLAKAKIENAYQLHRASGIAYPTATRVMDTARPGVEKVDVPTLEAVAKCLGVKRPLTLLEWQP